MKKISMLFGVLVFVLGLAGCSAAGGGPAASPNPAPDKSVEEIIGMITEDAGIETQTMITVLDSENLPWFLFMDPVEGAEAVAADAMMSAVAHSVVLARMPEGTDMEALKREVADKADPRKWICVEAEKTVVEVNGNLLLLVMSNDEVASAVAGHFLDLE
ncbi:hypothetical protein [Anaerotalea alkaliphila]|uniref:DUF4358 domain-containing protein n=1 Tax=Anaerotalea alkaliphila TaxID=2662126 RepID=A0A7X5HUS2_9FIRM|nr:hypothetical protein [Anaerotalea alkaliphila]NDL67055.1 hypothetical protein [Anaerotalea alkaliphila]